MRVVFLTSDEKIINEGFMQAKTAPFWLEQLAKQATMEKPLSQAEYRVRDWLIGTIGVGKYAFVNQSEMARSLRIPRSEASRVIKQLLARKILFRGPKWGCSHSYMVSPE